MSGGREAIRIRRGRVNSDFTAISNSLIDNVDMSAEARLAIIYFLSKPADWELQIADLRRLLRCGRDKAYAVLREIRDARYVEARRVTEGGRFVGFEYVVYDAPIAPAEAAPFPEKPDTELPDTENQDRTKERKKQNTEGLFGAREDAFATWWAAFPNKVGRADALKAFEQAIRKAPIETLLAGVSRYIASKPATRAWCNPGTWLRQERWLDEPGAAPADGKVGTAPKRADFAAVDRQIAELQRQGGTHAGS